MGKGYDIDSKKLLKMEDEEDELPTQIKELIDQQ